MRSEVEILKQPKVIAVIGASNDQERATYRTPLYLQRQGYRIIPINPNETEVLGEKAYARIGDVRVPFDIVYIMRRSDAIPGAVGEAIKKGAKVIWLPLRVTSVEGEAKAKAAGVEFIQDRCLHCAVNEHKAELGLA